MTDFTGTHVWTDGLNVYYSVSRSDPDNPGSYIQIHRVLVDGEWETKEFGGSSYIDGGGIWTDGVDMFYSNNGAHYVLKDGAWVHKYWGSCNTFLASNIWSDGSSIYLSSASDHYIRNGDSWIPMSWDNEDIHGNRVWTDGTNIYCRSSSGTSNYILHDNTWEPKIWDGAYSPDTVGRIWSDGANVYCSLSPSEHYVLSSEQSSSPIDPVPAYYLYGEESDEGNILLRTSDGTKRYKGAVFPELPEYDKEKFPYMYADHYSLGTHRVWILENPLAHKVTTYPDTVPVLGGTSVESLFSTGEAKVLYIDSDLDVGEWEDTASPSSATPYWANHDILREDGTVYRSASISPIPMGLSYIVTYKYNGHEGAALPAWDRRAYPYAILIDDGSLVCTTTPFYYDGEHARVDTYDRLTFDYDGVYYDIPYHFNNVKYASSAKWSNHDIFNADGTVYLAASNPIDVKTGEEIDVSPIVDTGTAINPGLMFMGYIVGRAIAGQITTGAHWETIFEGTLIADDVPEDFAKYPVKGLVRFTAEKYLAWQRTYRLTVNETRYLLTANNEDDLLPCIGNYYIYTGSVNDDTGLEYFIRSDAGTPEMIFMSLEPGTYRVKIEKELNAESVYDKYYYNGSIYPVIPEEIRKEYPYWIIKSGFMAFEAWGSHTPVTLAVDGKLTNGSAALCKYARFEGDLFGNRSAWCRWGEWIDEVFRVDEYYLRWANHDVLNEDGSIYMAGSEPVPIT
ncbi:MAG: hypothetical protein IKZ08_02540 [Bacteroidales bacterium]|nr:hypothetical protein [Bacteroidales bacterium]